MNKFVSLILLGGGIALIIFGVNATNSFASDVSRFFTGNATNKAMWMLAGGSLLAIVGLVGLAGRSKLARWPATWAFPQPAGNAAAGRAPSSGPFSGPPAAGSQRDHF